MTFYSLTHLKKKLVTYVITLRTIRKNLVIIIITSHLPFIYSSTKFFLCDFSSVRNSSL